MSEIVIVGIIVLGILLIMVEVFLIPGTTVVGLLGGLVVAVGVFFTFSELGPQMGWIALSLSSLLMLVLLYVGLKNLKRVAISESIDGKVNLYEDEELEIGEVGKAFTDCRPAGKAIFNGKKLNVYSIGDFIMKDRQVQVVKMQEGKVFVKEITLTQKL